MNNVKENHQYKIGDIIHRQWGYSMILNDFFQVIETTKKSIKIRLLKEKSRPNGIWGQSYVQPIKDEFCDNECLRRFDKEVILKKVGDFGRIKFECSYGVPYDGLEHLEDTND